MPHTFRKSRRIIISRADPLVRAGRPRPALFPTRQVSDTSDEPAGGPAADQGVRPTTGVSQTQKYAVLDFSLWSPSQGKQPFSARSEAPCTF
jgi:hypothetical protein